MDENLTDITLVYDGGVFTIFKDDKKSKAFNDKEIKTILSKLDATALDLPSSFKRDIEKMITTAKLSQSGNQIDLSADVKEVDKLRLT